LLQIQFKKKENDHWLKFENLLIPDPIFPVYKIDREQSEKTFLRNVGSALDNAPFLNV
jgi:hypothetical protein